MPLSYLQILLTYNTLSLNINVHIYCASAIMLSVLLWYTYSDCPVGIFKLFLDSNILDYHWKKWIDFLCAHFCIPFIKIEHIVRYIHTIIIYVYDKLPTIIGNRFKKNICLFLNPIVELLLFCLYMSVIPIKYVYTNISSRFTIIESVQQTI